MSGSQYARLVPKMHRSSRRLPKIDRPWRPRMIAWAGPSAFSNNRFYEQDKWYKARIDKPELIPKLHIIDPSNHNYSLQEYFAREKGEVEPVNIGFKKSETVTVSHSNEELSDLERKSRKMELLIEMFALKSSHDLAIFKHFNIFEDLFGKGYYFNNVQQFEVVFNEQEVFSGNVIPAAETAKTPKIQISSAGSEGFNTIIMTNIDGNPFDKEGQLIHWLVSNIPDNADISKGNEIVEYLQVLPFSGTGYHRVAFILFRHKKPIDVSPLASGLNSRVTSICNFYKQHEREITPSGISFFQTTYDNSVKEKLHELGLKSPIYEYEYTEALKPDQKEFPLKAQPFDLYLDMYRDPKEVEREMLEERLKRAQLDDYQAPEWLDINYNENKKTLPNWQHDRLLKREGKYRALHKNSL